MFDKHYLTVDEIRILFKLGSSAYRFMISIFESPSRGAI